MISFIFYALIFGCFLALIVGTLGDEIQGIITRISDWMHPEHQHSFTERQLQKYYQESINKRG